MLLIWEHSLRKRRERERHVPIVMPFFVSPFFAISVSLHNVIHFSLFLLYSLSLTFFISLTIFFLVLYPRRIIFLFGLFSCFLFFHENHHPSSSVDSATGGVCLECTPSLSFLSLSSLLFFVDSILSPLFALPIISLLHLMFPLPSIPLESILHALILVANANPFRLWLFEEIRRLMFFLLFFLFIFHILMFCKPKLMALFLPFFHLYTSLLVLSFLYHLLSTYLCATADLLF